MIPHEHPDLFDPPAEAVARDRALEQVAENAGEDFQAQVFQVMERIRNGTKVTGEDIRLRCERLGIEPHHPNAWGAVVKALLRADRMHATKEYRAMKAPGSHARRTRVYRVGPAEQRVEDPLARTLLAMAEQAHRSTEEQEILKAAARRVA